MKRKTKEITRILSFLPILFFLALMAYFSQSGFFNLAFIDCQKDEFSCSEKERILLAETLGKNIFLVDASGLKQQILGKEITLKEIQIIRKFPDALIVKMESRKPLAVLAWQNKNFLVDQSGFVFSQDLSNQPSLPLINILEYQKPILGNFVDSEVGKAITLVSILKDFYLPVKAITLEKNLSLTVLTGDHIAVFSTEKSFNLQASTLQLILRSSKINQTEKIDLRYEKPIIVNE